MEKTCPSCEISLPITAFALNKTGREGQPRAYCKPCGVVKNKLRRKLNPEHVLNIERRSKFKKQYGISLEQYEEMLHNQGYGCAICGTKKPSERTKYFAVDHCHNTGKVRGLLCTKCNRGLGLFNDKTDVLQKAVKYLLGV
jgi:hypothetical protein